MAFTQLVGQANRSGTFTSPSLTVPAGTTRLTIRLTSSNWPTGSGDSLAWAIDRSDDGGQSWREITDGVTPEGARDRNGNMPAVILSAPEDAPWSEHRLRARCRITGTMRFGLEKEIL